MTQNIIHLPLERCSKKADESSIRSYSSKSSSIASSLGSVSQAVEQSVDMLTRPLKRVKLTVLRSKKTFPSLPSSPKPSVIDVDTIDTATKSVNEEDLDAALQLAGRCPPVPCGYGVCGYGCGVASATRGFTRAQPYQAVIAIQFNVKWSDSPALRW
ncbi:uncharacterized protein EDB93DRAFT_157979 [Suillus bovinus]|uniref:uncharacterized protein n=1 Tax=Suillus bovinus TaxID=48563 RepID=UPI001B87A83A|nr:uncharacterized protein EDB93DRAFT_157979 [Suillus bovinus]KAG2154394.1 hypothetical protein EDB93DRAFT_157979 [Suillus bovinus]